MEKQDSNKMINFFVELLKDVQNSLPPGHRIEVKKEIGKSSVLFEYTEKEE